MAPQVWVTVWSRNLPVKLVVAGELRERIAIERLRLVGGYI